MLRVYFSIVEFDGFSLNAFTDFSAALLKRKHKEKEINQSHNHAEKKIM